MNDSDRIAELRIAWLEAEVAEVCSVARGLRDKLDEIKEVVGGASLHPETGVSVVDDVRDLKAENLRLSEQNDILRTGATAASQEATRLSEQLGRCVKVIKEMQDVLRVNLAELQFCHEFEEPFLHGIEHNSFVDSCPLCKIQKYHQNVFSYCLTSLSKG
jgi:hypothetical protein